MIKLDENIIELPCPACGKNIKQKLGWFKSNSSHCPFAGCGRRLDTDEFAKFRRMLLDVEKKFSDGIKKLPKKIEVKFKL